MLGLRDNFTPQASLGRILHPESVKVSPWLHPESKAVEVYKATGEEAALFHQPDRWLPDGNPEAGKSFPSQSHCFPQATAGH